jgi:hypothetical protein
MTGKTVLLVYTGIDAPDGRIIPFTEQSALAMLESSSYSLHESNSPEVKARLTPSPVTADQWFNHLVRTYLGLCNCLSTKEKRDELRAQIQALKLLRLKERAQDPSLPQFSEVPA